MFTTEGAENTEGQSRKGERRSVAHPWFARHKSGRGLPLSKTLRDRPSRRQVRQVLDCASPLPALSPGHRLRFLVAGILFLRSANAESRYVLRRFFSA